MKVLPRGFTLIELLVAISIIGLLSSVVVTSLRDARSNSIDTAVKAQLDHARSQAELYYAANGNRYTNVCNPGATAGGVPGMNAQVKAAAAVENLPGVTYGGVSATQVSCYANATSWLIQVPLKSGKYYCMTNDGNATTTAVSGASCALPTGGAGGGPVCWPPVSPPPGCPPPCPGAHTCGTG